VQDRVIAALIDFSLLIPTLGFLLSPLTLEMKRMMNEGPSLDLNVLLFHAVFECFLTTVFLQSLWLYVNCATPGMRVLKMKLVSYSPLQSKQEFQSLTYLQCLARSLISALQIFLLGIPFLEILRHPLRQALHDRAAETLVVTEKQSETLDAVELEKESRVLQSEFARSALVLGSLAALIWLSVFGFSSFQRVARGDLKRHALENSNKLCEAVKLVHKNAAGDSISSRVDVALALYLAGEQSEDCVHKETDFAFSTNNIHEQSWAYFAEGVMRNFDSKRAMLYFNQSCEVDAGSVPCRLGQVYFADKGLRQTEILRPNSSWTRLVLLTEELQRNGKFQTLAEELPKFAFEREFADYLQSTWVKVFWSQGEKEKALGAYTVVQSELSVPHRMELQAWTCLAQIESSCRGESHGACTDLQMETRNTLSSQISSEAVIALIQENECSRAHQPLLQSFRLKLSGDQDLRNLALSLSSESHWSPEHREGSLISLIENPRTQTWVQRMAALSLAKINSGKKSAETLTLWLKKTDEHDWLWQRTKLSMKAPDVEAQGRLPASQKNHNSKVESPSREDEIVVPEARP
jgi:uncharacterized RDD family membrane protein YckC